MRCCPLARARLAPLALALCYATARGQARAEYPPPPAQPRADAAVMDRVLPSPVRVLAAIGMHEGAALGLALDGDDLLLRLSGGYLPVLIRVESAGSLLELEDPDPIEVFHTGQLNADAVWMPAHPLPSSRIGIGIGYRYNSLLRHGFGLAFQGEARLEPEASLGYTLGAYYFPLANDEIDERTTHSWHPFGLQIDAQLLFGAGVSIILDL